jgi:hypothetical protein
LFIAIANIDAARDCCAFVFEVLRFALGGVRFAAMQGIRANPITLSKVVE